MSVTRLTEEDWERLRDVRLAAVAGEPDLYGWALAREAAFREPHWRMRLRGAAWWVATRDGADVGLVQLLVEPGAPADERHALGLWVEARHRRSGLGSALVGAAVDGAVGDGASSVSAWVPDGGAVAFATACGFRPTGERVPAPRRPGAVEERWIWHARPGTGGLGTV